MVYILATEPCTKDPRCNGKTPAPLLAIKVDVKGKQLVTRKLDTSVKYLNVYKFDWPGSSLAWNAADNTLGFIVTRVMNAHQGATGAVLDGKDLSIIRVGGGSSHSWANSLHVTEDGKQFLATDLGDNFPRGIQVFAFSKTESKKNKLVFTMKTVHCCCKPEKGLCCGKRPPYPEISTSTKKCYKVSNDNQVWINQ